jgi:hypothetical protein
MGYWETVGDIFSYLLMDDSISIGFMAPALLSNWQLNNNRHRTPLDPPSTVLQTFQVVAAISGAVQSLDLSPEPTAT